MPPRTRLPAFLLAGATLLAARSPRADVAPDAATLADAHRHAVVAHVGPRAVTVGELEDRLSPIPRFQLRIFGNTASEVVHSFFDRVLLREVLLSLGAEEKHLDHDLAVEQGLERALSSATLRAIMIQIGPLGAVPMDEVQRYYDANLSHYDQKPRVQIWRILCATRDEAQSVLDQAKKDGSVTRFMQLSREHNLDKATYLRGGNVGFAGDDGVSSEPGVTVDLGVVKAAEGVKDGELVPTPVPEGTGFAVVWRKGSQPGMHRSVAEVQVQIQDTLVRQKREAAQKALVDKLRAARVTMVDDSTLGDFEVSPDDGKIGERMRPRVRPVPSK